jgi:hypothetical protein
MGHVPRDMEPTPAPGRPVRRPRELERGVFTIDFNEIVTSGERIDIKDIIAFEDGVVLDREDIQSIVIIADPSDAEGASASLVINGVARPFQRISNRTERLVFDLNGNHSDFIRTLEVQFRGRARLEAVQVRVESDYRERREERRRRGTSPRNERDNDGRRDERRPRDGRP